MDSNHCYHCGDQCRSTAIVYDKKIFCCHGCKTVYDLFKSKDLLYYYELQEEAGRSPVSSDTQFDYLEQTEIIEKLLDFDHGDFKVISFNIPNIHCSSCIYVLENLHKIHPGIQSAQVDFPRQSARVNFKSSLISLKDLVILLNNIGYPPYLSADDLDKPKIKKNRKLIYQLGVAGFAFGNIMFLSFPEYFDLYGTPGTEADNWFLYYKGLFRWLMFGLSLPVVFYAGKDYLISAFKGIQSRVLNIDVPITLGILALFLRSTLEIFLDLGSGYFDSLSGLIFFLLVGKYFQRKTYDSLSFERDYKSYFPIATNKINRKGKEESIEIYRIKKGDLLAIRHGELIPADSRITKGNALIDYSFVTGESTPEQVAQGDKIFAGGKQVAGRIEISVIKSVSQSYLTQLWDNVVFEKDKTTRFQNLTDRIGKHFTLAVLSIAAVATAYWLYYDASLALNVFTAVLIIACPCAIALAAPFTLGNLVRILGRKGLYLKNAQVIERMAQTDTAIFDKTGTLSSTRDTHITYSGMPLNKAEESLLLHTLNASNHPLSRSLRSILKEHEITTLDTYQEIPGQGISGKVSGASIKAGAADYVGRPEKKNENETAVHISSNDLYKGYFSFKNTYREGMTPLFNSLKERMDVAVLSGDRSGKSEELRKIIPPLTPMFFGQKPEDKLQFISDLQSSDKKVLMVGDGLNDAGALAQSDVGIAVAEDVHVFSPACDAIIDANKLQYLGDYMKASKQGMSIIRLCLVFSVVYNLVGLYFAVTGQLAPIIAAILMPLSSISVVAFATLATNWTTRKFK